MIVLFAYRGQPFTWDSAKAASNLAKHGIAFEAACECFFDAFFLVEDASVEGEQRYALTGATAAGALLLVVHIIGGNEEIRLISARVATPQERLAYEEGD